MKTIYKIFVTLFLSFTLQSVHATTCNASNNLACTATVTVDMAEVYIAYFEIKDALIKSDAEGAASKAAALARAIEAVELENMQAEDRSIWIKLMPELNKDAQHIASTTNVKSQRNYFAALSQSMHTLMKAFPATETVYYQKCPMANGGKGANWLSKEKAIKNPYFGSAMLTCGSTVSTLK